MDVPRAFNASVRLSAWGMVLGKPSRYTVLTVLLADPVHDQIHCHVIRYQESFIDISLCFYAQLSSRLDVRPEDVPGRDMRDPVFFEIRSAWVPFPAPGRLT